MKTGVNPMLLVVDDEEEIREMVKLALAGKYTVVGVKSAENALVLLDTYIPQVVLSDINMGEMSGIALLQEKRLQGTPVVIMSGRFGGDGNPAEAEIMAMGAAGTLSKPFQIDNLEEVIKRALEMSTSKN